MLKSSTKYHTLTRSIRQVNKGHPHTHQKTYHTRSVQPQPPLYHPTQILLNKRPISAHKISISQQSIRTFFEYGGEGNGFDTDNGVGMEESESYEDQIDELTYDEEIYPGKEDGPDPQAEFEEGEMSMDAGEGGMSMDALVLGAFIVGGIVVLGFLGFCCVMVMLSGGVGEEDGRKEERREEERRDEEERKDKEWPENQLVVVV